MGIRIAHNLRIDDHEIEFSAIRAQGPGGQHVNKTASAVQLRFSIDASSLPERYKDGLYKLSDHRITQNGVVVIKSQQYRSQKMNKEAAVDRLVEMIRLAGAKPLERKPTRPSKAARLRRMEAKTRRSRLKDNRRRVDF